MKSTAKAEAILRDVADKLKVRFAGSATINSVRTTKDANGWPVVIASVAGNEAAGQPVIALRMYANDAVSTDVFGNALTAFAPHTMDIAYELGASGNATEPSHADLLKVEFEAILTGVAINLKELANGTAVTPANIAAAAATAAIENLYWPTKGV
jgi:hypothetical protein